MSVSEFSVRVRVAVDPDERFGVAEVVIDGHDHAGRRKTGKAPVEFDGAYPHLLSAITTALHRAWTSAPYTPHGTPARDPVEVGREAVRIAEGQSVRVPTFARPEPGGPFYPEVAVDLAHHDTRRGVVATVRSALAHAGYRDAARDFGRAVRDREATLADVVEVARAFVKVVHPPA